MNETLLWLLYALGGAGAFFAVHRRGWRIVPATLAGTLVTVVGWTLLFWLTAPDERPPWITLDLTLNASFGMIFAGAGAALAAFLNQQRSSGA